MALFLRGDVWWMEYRTRKTRRVLTTGFRRPDKAKAQAAYQALRLAMGAKPKRSAMEGVLSAIYDDGGKTAGIPLSTVWEIFADWCKGKGKVVAEETMTGRRNLMARLVSWAEGRGCTDIADISVGVARDYVLGCVNAGKSNKTIRNYCGDFSQIWEAVGQLYPGIHNPWKAATPDNDGSSVRKEIFTDEEVKRILKEAKRIGHDWYLASMIALHTGLRYGNIATMQVKDINFDKWLFTGMHLKTMHSSKAEVFIPVAEALKPLLLPFKGKEGFLLPEHGVKYRDGKHNQPLDVPFSEVLKAAGVTGGQYSFHSFRHLFSTKLAEAGISTDVRKILCGWTNDEMARHYDHSKRVEELRLAISKI